MKSLKKNNKTALFFVTHIINDTVMFHYQKILDEASDYIDVYMITEGENANTGDFHFSYPELYGYYNLNFHDWHGNCYLPILYFHKNLNSKYDFIWVVEYDIFFTSHWKEFFDFYKFNTTDFLVPLKTKIEKDWLWRNDSDFFRFSPSFKTLNCICRYSKKLLDTIKKDIPNIKGSRHFEWYLYDMCIRNGLSVETMDKFVKYETGFFDFTGDASPNIGVPNLLLHPIKKNPNILYSREKYKVFLYSLIKDEQRYLEEWINYHLSLGIDEIYLYEDISSTSHREITDKYKEVHLQSIYDISKDDNIEHVYRQDILINYLNVKKYCLECDYFCLLDVDEYITINEQNISEFILKNGEYDCFNMWWKNMSAMGLLKPPSEKYSLLETYTEECKYGKPLPNCTNLDFSQKKILLKVNGPCFIGNCVHNSKGNGMIYNTNRCFSSIYIRHFITKSLEEWIARVTKRGELGYCGKNYPVFFVLNGDMIEYYNETDDFKLLVNM